MRLWRIILACCLVAVLGAAKCESTKKDEDSSGSDRQTLLNDDFSAPAFGTHWTQAGAGAMQLDAGTGNAAPAAMLDPGGAACELESTLLSPIFPDWQAICIRVDVAIDGTPGSGASATVAIEDAAGADLASVTISEGQVLVNTPGTYSVTQLWTTDSQFHRLDFYLYPNGSSWWVRTHGTTAQISPGGNVGAVTGVRVSLRGASVAPAWFDNASAFVFGRTS